MDHNTQENSRPTGQNFFKFDKMITPGIIQIVFYIGVGLSVLFGLLLAVSESLFFGLVVIFVGILLMRIYCELIIVIFKIHEALQDIRHRR